MAIDPLGDTANTVEQVGRGTWGTIKNTFSSAASIMKPVGAAYAALVVYGAVSTGGVSALPELGERAVTGLIEASTDLSAGADWVSSFLSSPAAAAPAPA